MVIKHMANGHSFWSFAAEVDVCFDTLSEWTRQHEEFSEAKKAGMAKLLKFDEQLNLAGASGQLKRVARTETFYDENGHKREVTYHDSANFAQTYRIFLMKNRYPRLYRDKIQIEDTTDNSKKTRKTLVDLMNDPKLRDAALILADKLSDPDEPEES